MRYKKYHHITKSSYFGKYNDNGTDVHLILWIPERIPTDHVYICHISPVDIKVPIFSRIVNWDSDSLIANVIKKGSRYPETKFIGTLSEEEFVLEKLIYKL